MTQSERTAQVLAALDVFKARRAGDVSEDQAVELLKLLGIAVVKMSEVP